MAKKFPTARSTKRMVAEMSNLRTLAWIGVAFAVHVVIIGGTSMGYIRDRWLDPAGAEARRAAAAAETAQAAPAGTAATTPPATPAKDAAPKPKSPAASGASEEERMLKERKDSPMVKRVTEAAKSSELPKEPSLNSFDLDEPSR